MKPKKGTALTFLTVLFFLLSVSFNALAQLKADFILDKSGGCSPLTVKFTNTSSGASPNAIWSWDFGNGNISAVKDPAANFINESTYTITLTVQDGTSTSRKTQTVTVYKKPVFTFNVDPVNGCTPLGTKFKATQNGGDGNIATWHWDFGDGQTGESDFSEISHVYTFKQTASVLLTAVSEYGCSNTIAKEKLIRVSAPVIVNFDADKKFVCEPGTTINFTNTSTGSGTITYLWDFGDGIISTEKQPAHSYAKQGKYTVRLTVKSSDGCEISKTETNFINVKDFSSDFVVPSLNCEDKQLLFQNNSSPVPTNTTWYVDGKEIFSYPNSNLNFSFENEGKHRIKMVNSFGMCKQEVNKEITVKKNPRIDNFIVDIPKFCTLPAEVKFRDTSAEAVKWRWDLNYYYSSGDIESTVRNPVFKYEYETDYTVRLEIENEAGCTSSILQNVRIYKPYAYITTIDANGLTQCDSLTKQFQVETTEQIVSYRWNFGDGSFSTEATPTHTYNKPGSFTPSLTYKTANGCTVTTNNYFNIEILVKPTTEFRVQPTGCGNSLIDFIPQITGSINYHYWEWGDGTRSYWNDHYNGHRYQDTGTYTVSLISYNGYCNDTITKNNIITIKGPFPKIEKLDYSCEAERNTIVITDGTKHAKIWTWDFGDGNRETYTSYKPTITHSYSKTGIYTVRLIAENDNCILRDSMNVLIVKKQPLTLQLQRNKVCLNDEIDFKVTSSDPNLKSIQGWTWLYRSLRWETTGSKLFDGNYYDYAWNSYVEPIGEIYTYGIMKDSLRLIITNYMNGSYCNDTTNFAPLTVQGVFTGFEVLKNDLCFKEPVVLRDSSVATPGSSIVSRVWDFGDGETLTTSQTENIRHQYKSPGYYIVRLTAKDNMGCATSRTSDYAAVRVSGVKADFYLSPGTNVPKQTEVSFFNSSMTAYATGNVTYKWSFGDGAVSSQAYPKHSYETAGTYTAQLIAKDNGSACSDTVEVLITVTEVQENAAFYTTKTFIGDHGSCPPVRASFVFNSNISYTRLVWDFGDGSSLENQTSAAHTYLDAGSYNVTLKIYDGTTLVKTYREIVLVSTPASKLEAPDRSACIGELVKLYAPVKKNGYTYTWDFGSGDVQTGADSVASVSYRMAGSYTPSLIVRDARGCASSLKLAGKIIVHPDPVISIKPANSVVCKGEAVQLQASGASTYEWVQLAGLNQYNISNPLANPAVNSVYQVKAFDANGCQGTASVEVKVAQPIRLSTATTYDLCLGKQLQLNASGADSYKWINTTWGLTNTAIANPIASPSTTTLYTLVGSDQFNCYTDTAGITVTIQNPPTINSGDDKQVIVGEQTILQTTGSADILRWEWSPADYLSCSNCASPVVTPYSSKEYTLTVFNKYNCEAKDQVKITALCSGGAVYIPNAFTPNGDGLNDVFRIPPRGVSKIHYLRIFNSWGQLIFEKKDFYPADPAGNWDGRLKGLPAPAGTYIYQAEMECVAGERFQRKGTVTVIR